MPSTGVGRVLAIPSLDKTSNLGTLERSKGINGSRQLRVVIPSLYSEESSPQEVFTSITTQALPETLEHLPKPMFPRCSSGSRKRFSCAKLFPQISKQDKWELCKSTIYKFINFEIKDSKKSCCQSCGGCLKLERTFLQPCSSEF